MSVTVTTKALLRDEEQQHHQHANGRATLIDGQGNLLVLDTPAITLLVERDVDGRAMFGKAEMELIKHTVASYAAGEWVKASR